MNGKQILAHGGTDGDGDEIVFVRRAVQDGIFYKRLQNKARYCPVSGSIFNLVFHLKAPCVAQLLNVAVVFQVAQLIIKRNQFILFNKGALQQGRESINAVADRGDMIKCGDPL